MVVCASSAVELVAEIFPDVPLVDLLPDVVVVSLSEEPHDMSAATEHITAAIKTSDNIFFILSP